MNDIRNCSKCGGTHFGSTECPMDGLDAPNIIAIGGRKPSEAEIAEDLKRRIEEAFKHVAALMDEANQHGLLVQWDAAGPQPPLGRNKLVGLRLAKHY